VSSETRELAQVVLLLLLLLLLFLLLTDSNAICVVFCCGCASDGLLFERDHGHEHARRVICGAYRYRNGVLSASKLSLGGYGTVDDANGVNLPWSHHR
jgi:hypothetical protein